MFPNGDGIPRHLDICWQMDSKSELSRTELMLKHPVQFGDDCCQPVIQKLYDPSWQGESVRAMATKPSHTEPHAW